MIGLVVGKKNFKANALTVSVKHEFYSDYRPAMVGRPKLTKINGEFYFLTQASKLFEDKDFWSIHITYFSREMHDWEMEQYDKLDDELKKFYDTSRFGHGWEIISYPNYPSIWLGRDISFWLTIVKLQQREVEDTAIDHLVERFPNNIIDLGNLKI